MSTGDSTPRAVMLWGRLTTLLVHHRAPVVNPSRPWCHHPMTRRSGNLTTYWWNCKVCGARVDTKTRSLEVDRRVQVEKEVELAERAAEKKAQKAAKAKAKDEIKVQNPLRTKVFTLADLEGMAAGEAQYLRRASAAERKDRAQPKAEDLSQAVHSMIAAQTQAAAQMLALTSEVQGLTRHIAVLSTSSSAGAASSSVNGMAGAQAAMDVCVDTSTQNQHPEKAHQELLSKWSALDST